ncbi:uncharacterized protein LOC128548932 [Mercenaria mercenaria]|uniref:uncharacterized protein LOC128548932 n=1 Tax=Mercenaria mercenaria TaxID=6596 RepID=UPI00234F94AD|nr:uncharacterized protein LOC128548932 [Mercenaria mercenaria]
MYPQFQSFFAAHCLVEIYLINIVIIGSILSTETTTEMCDRCLNNSTCRIITNLQSNVSSFHCACLQGWLGERCQTRVRLLLVSVTMTTATLQWEYSVTDTVGAIVDRTGVSDVEIVSNLKNAQNSLKGLEPSQNDLMTGLSDINKKVPEGTYSFYTQAQLNVNYWTSSQRNECNIVPNLTKTVFTISGLDSRTEYTFCAKTDHSFTCDFDLVGHLDDIVPACIYVTTKADDTSKPNVYLIIISCIAVIGLIVLLIVVVVSKRNNYFTFLVCAKQHTDNRETHSILQGSSRRTESPDDSHPDIYRLKSPTANQTISISAPNCPGKPKYQLIKKRLRGYASFSAQNEQTIPLSTVLEYSEYDHDGEYEDSDADSDIAAETEVDTETNIHQITDIQGDNPNE